MDSRQSLRNAYANAMARALIAKNGPTHDVARQAVEIVLAIEKEIEQVEPEKPHRTLKEISAGMERAA